MRWVAVIAAALPSGELGTSDGICLLQQGFLKSRGQRERNNIVAVVNNHNGKDLSWLRDAGIKVDEVGRCATRADRRHPGCGARHIGESRSWLLWIVKHYDSLPDYVAFLHGEQRSWHTPEEGLSVEKLESDSPAAVEMLAGEQCVWKPDLPAHIAKGDEGGPVSGTSELPALNALNEALYAKDFGKAWVDFHMAMNNRCCTESLVSKAAIRKLDKKVYRALVAMIDKHPTVPWGWVFERSWQNLFAQPLARPVDQVLARLKAFSGAGGTALTALSRGHVHRNASDVAFLSEKMYRIRHYMSAGCTGPM